MRETKIYVTFGEIKERYALEAEVEVPVSYEGCRTFADVQYASVRVLSFGSESICKERANMHGWQRMADAIAFELLQSHSLEVGEAVRCGVSSVSLRCVECQV